MKTAGRVVVAGGVAIECTGTADRVVAAGGVAIERLKAVGRVEVAAGVAIERFITISYVVSAEGTKQGLDAVGCVAGAVRPVIHCLVPGGGVAGTDIMIERS